MSETVLKAESWYGSDSAAAALVHHQVAMKARLGGWVSVWVY